MAFRPTQLEIGRGTTSLGRTSSNRSFATPAGPWFPAASSSQTSTVYMPGPLGTLSPLIAVTGPPMRVSLPTIVPAALRIR
jgi:hypothetical protein